MSLVVLDTHTLIWTLNGDPKLSLTAKNTILKPDVVKLVPVTALHEIAIKAKLGKLTMPRGVAKYNDLQAMIISSGLTLLNTTFEHTEAFFNLPHNKKHKDPFDRMIVAKAIAHKCNLLSCDKALDPYFVPYAHSARIW